MPENLQGFFAEAKKGRFSTVANLSEEGKYTVRYRPVRQFKYILPIQPGYGTKYVKYLLFYILLISFFSFFKVFLCECFDASVCTQVYVHVYITYVIKILWTYICCCCCRNVFHYPFKVSFLVALFTFSKLVNGSQQKMNKKDVLHFYRHWKCLGKCL